MPVANPAAHELHDRGLALLRSNREREAVSCLREAVVLSPGHAVAHYHLGIAHRLLGELEEARAELRTALERDPTLAPACAQLGGLALVSGGLEEALTWFSRALTLKPGHRVSRYQMGIALRFAGYRQEAIAFLRASLEPGPGALPPLLEHRVHGQLTDALSDLAPGPRPLPQCAAPLLTELIDVEAPAAEDAPPLEGSGERSRIVTPLEAAQVLSEARSVLALTGSGISVGSGLATRKELWQRWDRDAAVSVFRFREDPGVLWKVIADFLGTGPHAPAPGHLALAECPNLIGIVTQNVDGLHQAAHRTVHGEQVPMPSVIELHGTLLETRCHTCHSRTGRAATSFLEAPRAHPPLCESCGGPLRPDVVLFGERVSSERMLEAIQLVQRCDVLLVVGTAMDVAPAADLPRVARARGAVVIELKRTPSLLSRSLDTLLVPGEADVVLPALMSALRGDNASKRTPPSHE
ncbi:Sir2 family NAD-dependent protein deacetylase [Hyalangium minutum]|uniref:protein acetyllysine N-acetyltransferase n=1 Tax=Hyalangium minutum TaxID=394096 RepID=A0A085W9Q2_9BACT|nr:Sir2 family NAD-dependent protein deacetylase [Hyalangium minutum]KFE64415.1 NAD-dependent protein deacetylase of SIR2 family protein [Hyalangium minutum]